MTKAQETTVILFPDGAPDETTTLLEKADTQGGMTGGEPVLRITDVSEPTITIFPAPEDRATGAAVLYVRVADITFWLTTWKDTKCVNG